MSSYWDYIVIVGAATAALATYLKFKDLERGLSQLEEQIRILLRTIGGNDGHLFDRIIRNVNQAGIDVPQLIKRVEVLEAALKKNQE